MKLFHFLSLVLACLGSIEAAPPNIVLLMGDDHGWDETGYVGHPYLKTPVLDEMARTGLRLDHFYSGGASCSPTRATVMTGRHHNRSGVFDPGWSTRPEEITIAHLLKKAGYATAHFGKWHLGAVKAESPLNPGKMGFDEYLSHDNFFELNPWFSRNGGPPEQFHGESSEIIVSEALKFITQSQKAGKPFFVVIWYGSPHEPYSGLEKDLALYDHLPADFGNKMVRLTSNETGLPCERLQRDVLRERFAEITAMDRSIGMLRDHLKSSGLRDDTLVWYCGDNGTPAEAVATVPFRGHKGAVYEGGIRVPCVIEWPARIASPRTTNMPAVTSDMLPTLCEISGQPLPDRPLDGISLVPMFDGRMNERPSPIMFWMGLSRFEKSKTPYIEPALQAGTTPLVKKSGGGDTRNFKNLRHPSITEDDYNGQLAVIGAHYKLVIDRGGKRSSSELFDLGTDSKEEVNLIDSHKAEAETLEKQMREWQQSVLRSLTGADYK